MKAVFKNIHVMRMFYHKLRIPFSQKKNHLQHRNLEQMNVNAKCKCQCSDFFSWIFNLCTLGLLAWLLATKLYSLPEIKNIHLKKLHYYSDALVYDQFMADPGKWRWWKLSRCVLTFLPLPFYWNWWSSYKERKYTKLMMSCFLQIFFFMLVIINFQTFCLTKFSLSFLFAPVQNSTYYISDN